MLIGCVKEIKNNEFRVGMTPMNVNDYVKAGHEVLIESSAGVGSGFSDQEYMSMSISGKICSYSPIFIWLPKSL
jgi:alanine dehydrogenase